MSFCIDKACGLSADEDGHMGSNLYSPVAVGVFLSPTSGVREGVQKECKADFTV